MGRRSAVDAEAFARDWALGLSRPEIGALHGLGNANSVTRVARRLGLPDRNEQRRLSPDVLTGGRWVTRPPGVQVWERAS